MLLLLRWLPWRLRPHSRGVPAAAAAAAGGSRAGGLCTGGGGRCVRRAGGGATPACKRGVSRRLLASEPCAPPPPRSPGGRAAGSGAGSGRLLGRWGPGQLRPRLLRDARPGRDRSSLRGIRSGRRRRRRLLQRSARPRGSRGAAAEQGGPLGRPPSPLPARPAAAAAAAATGPALPGLAGGSGAALAARPAMASLGDKLAGAQSHVSRWVGSVRRSLHEALDLVTAAVAPERAAGEGPGRAPFKRTASFRQLASRGRDSFRQFSVRSQRRLSSLRKRPSGGPEQPSPTPELDHLKQCFGRPAAEARDTDVLVQEADGRYGTWGDQWQSGDSFPPESPSSESSVAPAQKPPPGHRASLYSSQRGPATAAAQQESSREQRSHSLDDSSPDTEPASPPKEKASPDFSFLEQTPRLDSRLLKSRILLDKRRRQHRAPISHTHRRGPSGDAQPAPSSVVEGAASAWMFRDSTEEKPPRRGEEEEEEDKGSPPAERLFPGQPRLPLFPGLPPSALKAQLRKRHESEGRREEAPPAPLCKSPKGPFPARGSGGRALATTPEKEGRPEELPPPWLTELKSRRKQGQPESPI